MKEYRIDLRLFDDNIQTITTAGDALRSDYLPGLRVQINEKTSPTVAQIERTSKGISGKNAVWAMRHGRQGGVAFIAEDGSVPTPYARQTKQVTVETKNVVAHIQISEKAIRASQSDVAAFANLLTADLKDALTDAKEQYGRSFWGDGTGAITKVKAHTDEVLTMVSVVGIFEGMLLSTYDAAGVVHDAALRVMAVNRRTKAVTVDAETNTENDDLVYLAGSKDKELTGFHAVMDDAIDIYGLTGRSTTYPWTFPVEISVNGEITDEIIDQGCDDARDNAGAEIDLLAGANGVVRAYATLHSASRRQNDTVKLLGGWSGIAFNNGSKTIPLVKERYATSGELMGLVKSDWKVYQMADWDWMDRDGAILARVANKLAYGAILYKFAEVGCACPAGQVIWKSITEH